MRDIFEPQRYNKKPDLLCRFCVTVINVCIYVQIPHWKQIYQVPGYIFSHKTAPQTISKSARRSHVFVYFINKFEHSALYTCGVKARKNKIQHRCQRHIAFYLQETRICLHTTFSTSLCMWRVKSLVGRKCINSKAVNRGASDT